MRMIDENMIVIDTDHMADENLISDKPSVITLFGKYNGTGPTALMGMGIGYDPIEWVINGPNMSGLVTRFPVLKMKDRDWLDRTVTYKEDDEVKTKLVPGIETKWNQRIKELKDLVLDFLESKYDTDEDKITWRVADIEPLITKVINGFEEVINNQNATPNRYGMILSDTRVFKHGTFSHAGVDYKYWFSDFNRGQENKATIVRRFEFAYQTMTTMIDKSSTNPLSYGLAWLDYMIMRSKYGEVGLTETMIVEVLKKDVFHALINDPRDKQEIIDVFQSSILHLALFAVVQNMIRDPTEQVTIQISRLSDSATIGLPSNFLLNQFDTVIDGQAAFSFKLFALRFGSNKGLSFLPIYQEGKTDMDITISENYTLPTWQGTRGMITMTGTPRSVKDGSNITWFFWNVETAAMIGLNLGYDFQPKLARYSLYMKIKSKSTGKYQDWRYIGFKPAFGKRLIILEAPGADATFATTANGSWSIGNSGMEVPLKWFDEINWM